MFALAGYGGYKLLKYKERKWAKGALPKAIEIKIGAGWFDRDNVGSRGASYGYVKKLERLVSLRRKVVIIEPACSEVARESGRHAGGENPLCHLSTFDCEVSERSPARGTEQLRHLLSQSRL